MKKIIGGMVGFNHLGSDTGAELFVMEENGTIVNITAETDPDDGYRSWMRINVSEVTLGYAIENTVTADYERFLADPIFVEVIIEEGKNYDSVSVRELNGDEFIKIYTDDYDDYYPLACIEYYPEKLSINRNKEN